jgi:peptide/nickel transport system ATP-binding protein
MSGEQPERPGSGPVGPARDGGGPQPAAAVTGHDAQGPGARDEERQPILQAVGLTKHYPVHRHGRAGLGRRLAVHAVDGVDVSLYAGQVTALVGESGSGKSTVARVLAQLIPASGGAITLAGKPVRVRRGRPFRRYARHVQLIFQDPFSSLNPTHTVSYVLTRPLRIHRFARSADEARAGVARLLDEVNLTPPGQFAEKFPHELSGGQRQRVAVARALAARPEVLLADEPVSMLDVSIRLSILNLLQRLVTEHNLALLYITHDIASARYFAATTLVMYAGQLVEGGPSETVTQQPAHPYTQLLIASAPDPEHLQAGAEPAPTGEPPSLVAPPPGCRFHPRCPHAMDICRHARPPRTDLGDGQWVHCWLHAARTGSGEQPAGAPHPGEEGRPAGPGAR